MTSSLAQRRTALALFALPLAVSACLNSGSDRRLESLALRVDSLAVTVGAMNSVLQAGGPAAQPESVTVSAVGTAVLGSTSAPVTIVEFTDYQCPFCARHATTTFVELKRDFIDKGVVRYVLRDLPLTEIHPLAEQAAQAARCAGAQSNEKYWQYHDALFAAQKTLSDTSFSRIAAALRLDGGAFSACLASERFASEIARDAADAANAGLSGTPAFVIGRTGASGMVSGVSIRGAYPYAQFKAAINAALEPAAVAARE